MRSVAFAASSLAFAASVMAQVPGFAAMSAPAEGEVVPAGSTYTIRWGAGAYTSSVKIALLGGQTPETLVVGETIATGVQITDESYSWNVDCSLGEMPTYGLQITDEANPATFQYSFPFHIDNSNCGAGGETSSSTPAGYPTSAPPVSSSMISVTQSAYPTISPPQSTQSETDHVSQIPSVTSSYATVPSQQPGYNTTFAPTGIPSATTSVEPIVTAAAGRNAVSLAAIGGIVAAVFAL